MSPSLRTSEKRKSSFYSLRNDRDIFQSDDFLAVVMCVVLFANVWDVAGRWQIILLRLEFRQHIALQAEKFKNILGR